jgi:hypothetical protein
VILILLSRYRIPVRIPLNSWQFDLTVSSQLEFLIDGISWPFAVTVVLISLAVFLVDSARLQELDTRTLASGQVLGGVGLIAVIAGNPLTLLMSWAVLDIVETIILLPRMVRSSQRERVIIAFSVRIAGIMLFVSAILRANGMEIPLSFDNIPLDVGGYLVFAAGLRLGVLPSNQPHFDKQIVHQGLGTIIYMIPIASSVVLLARVANIGVFDVWASTIMILTMVSVMLSSIAWVRSDSEIRSRYYWILGMGAFTLASAVKGFPDACTAWGLAMLLAGTLLFLFSNLSRRLLVLPFLGALGFSVLPLTPSWEVSAFLYSLPIGYRLVFLVALALMLIGYISYAFQSDQNNDRFESWTWLTYLFGLAILLFAYYGLIYTKWVLGLRVITFQTPGWWSGFVSLGLVAIILIISRKTKVSLPPFFNRIGLIFDWSYRLFWWVYSRLSRSLSIIMRLLEGDGSFLWALLILILIVVIINFWSGRILEL